jgi:dCMP deaminase
MKKSWDQIWIQLAHQIADRSYDSKLKVGAVIVTVDNESVLSIGYNGDEKGGLNKRDSIEPGGSGFLHAEMNAIAKCNYADLRPRKIYLTHSPCKICARLIINTKIEKVLYDHEFREIDGLELLKKRGIEVIKIPHWE